MDVRVKVAALVATVFISACVNLPPTQAQLAAAKAAHDAREAQWREDARIRSENNARAAELEEAVRQEEINRKLSMEPADDIYPECRVGLASGWACTTALELTAARQTGGNTEPLRLGSYIGPDHDKGCTILMNRFAFFHQGFRGIGEATGDMYLVTALVGRSTPVMLLIDHKGMFCPSEDLQNDILQFFLTP